MRVRHGVIPGVLVAALLTAAPPGMAQPASAIKQGFDAAWAKQPEQRSKSRRREAADAAVEAASRWTPQPPALELLAKTDRLNRNEGVREYDAAVALPLWLPGERPRAQAAAAAESSAVDARLQAAQWRLAGEVRELYWAAQRAQVEHDLARQRLANAEQIAADVARRVKAGDLARADSHQAESAVAAAQSALAEATVALTGSAQAWQTLTDQPPTAGASEPRPGAGPLETHPQRVELSSRRELASRQRDLASVQTRANPEVTIGAVRERDAFAQRYGQSIVVGLRIPLGATDASRSRLAAANADLVEAESQLELDSQRRQAQVQAANARVTALQGAHDAALRRATLARESRGFFDKSFRLGESDLPTRLRIELEAFEAERQAARSRIEVDAAVSQLRQALGLLPE